MPYHHPEEEFEPMTKEDLQFHAKPTKSVSLLELQATVKDQQEAIEMLSEDLEQVKKDLALALEEIRVFTTG
jgi:hypothetical protein